MKPIEIIIAAINHIETRLGTLLTLEKIARRLGYSRYYLHHLFTETVGIPMHMYIQRRRLTEAAKYLVYSELPILKIALQSGYESQQAFSMIFKAMYKSPPGRFRQENKKFYPLQTRFEFKAPRMDSNAKNFVDSVIRPAGHNDTMAWMHLVRQVVDGFPCLNETEHESTLQNYIARHHAFIMEENDNAIGIMMLSPGEGCIDFLGIHPLYRHSPLLQTHLSKAQDIMNAHSAISITTYRRGDRADTGYRRVLKALGFTEGEHLVEFGYPTQRMFLPTNHVF